MRYLFLAALTCALPAFASQWQAPPAEKAELYAIGNAASAERIERDITKLVSFGTRHTLSDTVSDTRGIGAARRWIESEFKRISKNCGGCLEVITVTDTVSGKRIPEPTEVVNVIAIQRGKTDPQRVVMMAGDIDSRVTDVLNASADSPGANDNASGVAGALEAARILSQYRFNGTIVYAALSGEEQGLYGGAILANYAKQQGWNIDAVLNNDMIGNIAGINGVIDNRTVRVFSEGTRYVETEDEARLRRFTGGEVDSPSRNLARYIKKAGEQYVPNLDVMMIYRLDRFGRGGHHRPFNEAGFPGVRIMETWEHYDRQHQDLRTENGITYGDTLDGVNFPYAAKLTNLNAVTLASLAWAPAPPADVSIEGAVSPDTTLKWKTPAHADKLAGYRIYWRLTTDSEWRYSRYVGKTNAYTLNNIVIDNYFFGVASVAEDGSESPVVFPGPAGAF
ncbi:M28 family metallopeptidase [Simiduia agarivorans]|uniref:Peptidase M28 n=1 Tax=Simiduia agarivorans (strain DSM 21679 / JCM 13881 / BCRC 17597 / SA1) TaxID=1117647 RepID=K4KGW7_SIMAS|nr:M28 family metallopeptidase [Simiduia agarivorans]AFU98236.1 peptidase M28 [Simiduia agarivorans SA1 = DSM 21679]